MAGVKTTPVKKVPRSNSASLCRVCGSQVYLNGGFYSLVAGKLEEENIIQRIAELFGLKTTMYQSDNIFCARNVLDELSDMKLLSES